MAGKTRSYATDFVSSFDGTQLFFESYGEGTTFVPCNGLGVSTFFWRHLQRYFSEEHRVILWDYRSHGQSEQAPNLNDLTITNNARDLKAIMDHNNVEKAILLGHSMGVQTIFEFYRLFPERVLALIPVLGSYGSPLNTFLNTDLLTYFFPAIHTISFTFPRSFNTIIKSVIQSPIAFPGAKLTGLVNWQHCKRQELQPYLEHLIKLDLRVFFGMGKHMQDNNAKDLLPKINVPTLIIAGEDDIFTPWHISDEMHRKIKDSEILTIPHGSHAAIIEQPELINLRIEKFLRERITPLLKTSTKTKPKKKAAKRESIPKTPKKKVATKKKSTTKKSD